ncbi:hypothetical protein ACMBCN_00905 [Candidatus Liberibacter asiaticus]
MPLIFSKRDKKKEKRKKKKEKRSRDSSFLNQSKLEDILGEVPIGMA